MTAPRRRMRGHSLAGIFAIPALLAATSTVGLLSALLGDDFWDVLSWIALGIPLAACLWYGSLRRAG